MTEPRSCPHCASHDIVEIVYGLPSPELMGAAARGEVELGGCVISGNDRTHECRACGSVWAASTDARASPISELFAEYFANWDIHLPPGSEAAMRRGIIRKAGWTIRYIFGTDPEPYLEFYAVHRMTNDRRVRIHQSRRTESLEAMQSMYMYDPKVPGERERTADENRQRNLRIAQELREFGLYPEGSINAYLSTHDVPPYNPGQSDTEPLE